MKPLCTNCERHNATIGRRCTRCHRHWVAHGHEYVPLPPQAPRVELYRRGKCVAIVDTEAEDTPTVADAQDRLAKQYKVPPAAFVPVRRCE